MEMNEAYVPQHNFFRGKLSFVEKKNRLGELSTEEMQEIVNNAVPETTEKATKFRMKPLTIHIS